MSAEVIIVDPDLTCRRCGAEIRPGREFCSPRCGSRYAAEHRAPHVKRKVVAEWRERAACRGLDGSNGVDFLELDHRHQRTICRGCPVRFECLEFALADEAEVGTWFVQLCGQMYGGTTGADRARMRRRAR